MRLSGDDYSNRLNGLSQSTLELIAYLLSCDRKTALAMSDITTDSELTEEQVVEKLLELKKKIK